MLEKLQKHNSVVRVLGSGQNVLSMRIAEHKKLLRFGLLAYVGVWLLSVSVFLAFHLSFYRIDWSRYDTDSAYHNWVAQKVLPLGVLQIKENVTGIHDFWLALPFLIGLLLSLVIFIFFWKNFRGRTLMPVFVFLGYLFPLLPLNDGNLLTRVFIGFGLILFGSITTIFSTKAFDRD